MLGFFTLRDDGDENSASSEVSAFRLRADEGVAVADFVVELPAGLERLETERVAAVDIEARGPAIRIDRCGESVHTMGVDEGHFSVNGGRESLADKSLVFS